MEPFAVNQRLTPSWSLEQDLAAWAQADVPSLGLLRSKVADLEAAQLQKLLAQHNRQVLSVSWVGGFTGSDGRRFRDAVADAQTALELAAAVGARCLVTRSGSRGGHTHNHARRLFRDGLQELAPEAEKHDLLLVVETIHPDLPQTDNFLASLDDALELLDRVNHPQVKLLLDLYHAGFEPDLVGRLPELAERIGLVQLADATSPPQDQEDRCLLGQGMLPLEEIVAALRQGGYEGPWEVELAGPQVESLDPLQVLKHCRAACEWLLEGGPKPGAL